MQETASEKRKPRIYAGLSNLFVCAKNLANGSAILLSPIYLSQSFTR